MSDPSDLFTLDQAKAQLRIVDTDSDVELADMITAASAIVLNYIDAGTVISPLVVRAGLLVLSALYEDREGLDDPLGIGAMSLLRSARTPTLS